MLFASLICLAAAEASVQEPINTDPYLQDLTHHSGSCDVVDGELVCFQKPAAEGALRVACVGDSITAVGHTSSVAHHYPNQLQDILDATHGNGTYSVTNLGVCGAALQKNVHNSWWNTGAYKTLVANRWDIVMVMLGTNDAHPYAWPAENHENCDNATLETLSHCNYANDYKALLDVIKTVGPDASTPPEVHIMIPTAEMKTDGDFPMIINTVLPHLIPLIGEANSDIVSSVIDVYTEMGGVVDWQKEMPTECVLHSPWPPCKWYCDEQSCDQTHCNDVGCAELAQVVYDGKGPWAVQDIQV